MRAVVIGAAGQVGYELCRALSCAGEVCRLGREAIDLSEPTSLARVLGAIDANVIVNAASYNDVDGAERNVRAALRVNAESVAALGEIAKARGMALVHYSTDFVFDGHSAVPYSEDDVTAPLSEYGRTKRLGEQWLCELDAPAIVLRTAWVYSVRRKSFVSAMLRALRRPEPLRVVTDQVGSPTFCRDLAIATLCILRSLGPHYAKAAQAARGIYHLAGDGFCSRFELAQAIRELDPHAFEHQAPILSPILASDLNLPARRPQYSVLDGSKAHRTFGVRLPPWRDSLKAALNDYDPLHARDAVERPLGPR